MGGNSISMMLPGPSSQSAFQLSTSILPDSQKGKVCIVTGGNTGIGYEVCKWMLKGGARVYMGARNEGKAGEAIAKLKEETGSDDIHSLFMDLASLATIQSAASQFLSLESRLDVLYLNAAINSCAPNSTSVEGYQLTFATNVLGHHVFTMALLEVLGDTAKREGESRVASTGSYGAVWTEGGRLRAAELDGDAGEKSFKLYCRSKLGNATWTHAMTERYTKDKGILFFTVHPGTITTDNFNAKPHKKVIGYLIGYPPIDGALSILFAGLSPDLNKSDSGSFIVPWARVGNEFEAESAKDKEQGDELWEWLEERRRREPKTEKGIIAGQDVV